MKKGFRTYAEAFEHRCPEVERSQAERQAGMEAKEPVYAEYEQFFLGEVADLKNLSQYRIFWRERIVLCPAWRSDRVDAEKPFCRAMAIVVHRDEEGELIHCPECSYFGEFFTAYEDDARSRA